MRLWDSGRRNGLYIKAFLLTLNFPGAVNLLSLRGLVSANSHCVTLSIKEIYFIYPKKKKKRTS